MEVWVLVKLVAVIGFVLLQAMVNEKAVVALDRWS